MIDKTKKYVQLEPNKTKSMGLLLHYILAIYNSL